jgi:hypothetical protein
MTYTFHNRFTIFDERLNIDANTHELAYTEHERVILLAGAAETMIKDTGDPVRPASDRRGGWPGCVRSLRLASG